MTAIHPPQSEELTLVSRAQAGCGESLNQLVRNFQGLARRMASRFFLPGAEREDVLQEALLGLTEAIKGYQPRYQKSFYDYAVLCIRNSLVRAIRGATRKKHLVLTQASDVSNEHTLAQPRLVEEVVVARLLLKQIWVKLCRSLSPLELQVLKMKLEGKSSEEISDSQCLTLKQVENSLFRARQKARVLLAEESSQDILAA